VTDALARLLAVQDLDTSITQLQHRRDALVETSGLAAVEAELVGLEAERSEVAARRAALGATQKDLEEQIAGISGRRGTMEQRMYAATSSSSRDLQAMNDEVRHLTERRAELEELELVAMLDQDGVDAELAALRERMAPLEARAAELRGPPTLLVGSGPPDDSGSPVHSPFKSCGDDDAGLGLGQVTDSTLERQTYPPVPWPRRRGRLKPRCAGARVCLRPSQRARPALRSFPRRPRPRRT